ncbi:MAG: hypothetical protein Q9195_009540 [Heterodermia aff. obscurata]
MLPFARSDGDDPFWNVESVAEENRDWVPTTTAALFSSPFYVTNQQGNLLGHQPHVNASVGVPSASDPPLRPADTAGTAADNSNPNPPNPPNPAWPVFGNFDHFDPQWQVPPATAAAAHHAHTPSHFSQSPTELSAHWTGQSSARELLGTSSYLPGGGLGDTQKNKIINQQDLPPQTPALPRPASTRPASTSAKTASPISSANTRSRLSASVPPAQTSPNPNKSQSRTTLPKTISPTRKRAREGIPKSPAAKQSTPRAPIQPNEEEQARRIHMAAYTRGTSLVSETSSQSRGPAEASSAKRDNDLRAAESSLLESIGAGRVPGVLRTPNVTEGASEEFPLPLGKGFPIQIGSELFRLSGASILAPSYFSRFFEEQLRSSEDPGGGVKTLYIDRDPTTFHDICRHLQGYVIQPTDGAHYVRLFADAQFYGLPRLISQLFESETVVQIGGENFTVPRDIFSNLGDTPNFFSLGFAVFFSTPNGVYPGVNSAGLLRPPPVKPPTVPNRSARVFAEILHLLRGYPLTIRDENHRAELLRDCKYFNLKGLEQKLIVHSISYNASSSTSEIVIRLEDIRQSGVSFIATPSPSDSSPVVGWVHYARPYVDEEAYELILEMSDEACKINLRYMRADFYGLTKARISKLFQVIANKMGLPVNAPLGLLMAEGGAASGEVSPGTTGLSEDQVKVRIGPEAFIILDGEEYVMENQTFEPQETEAERQESPAIDPERPQTSLSSAASNRSVSALGSTRPTPAQGLGIGISSPRPDSRTSMAQPPPRKRKRRGSFDDFGEWIIRRGQWRLRVQPRPDSGKRGVGITSMSGISSGGIGGDGTGMEIVMHAVKLDAVSGQRGRNMMRCFLDGG